MCPVFCFTLHDMCHWQRAVSDSVCKRPMIAPDWCRPWGHLCPQLLGQMEQRLSWRRQWMSCSCCRPVMVTIQEVIASTGLPLNSRERLSRVMRQYGYAEGDTLGIEVHRMTQERLEAAARAEELLPPLTLREIDALLVSAGKRVMVERKMS